MAGTKPDALVLISEARLLDLIALGLTAADVLPDKDDRLARELRGSAAAVHAEMVREP